jgi:hypothetical protein
MILKRTTLLLIVLLFVAGFTNAQVSQQSGWFASFNTISLNKKLSLHAEIQVRSTDNWEQVQTILPRIGLNYHIRPNQIFTAGYAFIPHRVVLNSKSSLLAENRIFQQFIVSHKVLTAGISHRFRLEERFVPTAELNNHEVVKSGTLYSTRLRYFIRAIIPFSCQQPFTKGMFGALQNELFLTVTNKENVNGQVFDQNRAYAAIGYRFSKKLDLEMGYMSQYVARRPLIGGNFNNDVSNNIIQLAVFTRF